MGNQDGTDHKDVHLEAVWLFLGFFFCSGKAYFFNRALMSFYSHSLEDMWQELDTACLGLVVVGIVFGISVFIQNSLFTFLQEHFFVSFLDPARIPKQRTLYYGKNRHR